ncbi:MAG: TonB-dependent receptor plug domain-containing protein, partial [Proteiniphilum sp.]|nr:TonB-dependent receptor plug domain-containing protein [Proteiniphilum sp.]
MNYYRINTVKAKFFLLFCVMICLQNFAYAQTNARITLNRKKITVIDALREIEKQSSFSIAFNESQLAGKEPVDLNVKNESVEKVLAGLLKDTGFTYQIRDSYIVIVQNAETVQQAAQKKVTGVVLDENEDPLIGVTIVRMDDPASGTSTNLNGEFFINASEGGTLLFSYIGYNTKAVQVTGSIRYTIRMEPDTKQLSEVVVTALGLRRSEKALSYNVQQIDGDNLVGIRDANFINTLAGKIAGVTINSSSSGIGGSSKVVMRGTKSISGNNNALYVIDGIPMPSLASTQPSDLFTGMGQSGDGAADINPDDIESISVLTGPAAAALYGSEAANGVVLITTKQGEIDKDLSITFTNNTQFSSPFVTPRFQNTYGSETGSFSSWGE